MIKISRREYQLHPYKYLSEGSFIVTNRGVPEYVVTIKNYSKNVVTSKNSDNVVTLQPDKIDEVLENTAKHLDEKDSDYIVNKPIVFDKVQTATFKPVFVGRTGAYGCGCVMTTAKLCPKHKRT